MDELTIDLCVDKFHKQTVFFDYFKIIKGLSPMCNSFNAALDFAFDNDCDLLFHTGADVLLNSFAAEYLLKHMNLETDFLAVGKGFDVLNGFASPAGVWIFNINIFKDKHRFRDEFVQDMKLMERVERDSGFHIKYTPSYMDLAYHHPIYTPKDIYGRLRYSTRKYDQWIIDEYNEFLVEELKHNPTNKVLKIGQLGLKNGKADLNPDKLGSKNYAKFKDEYDQIHKAFKLTGKEFYVFKKNIFP